MFKLLKAKYNKKLWVRDIIVNSGNEILSFKLTYNDRHMIFRDPKKLFSVSIPEACKVFGIKHSKHEFNHDEDYNIKSIHPPPINSHQIWK